MVEREAGAEFLVSLQGVARRSKEKGSQASIHESKTGIS